LEAHVREKHPKVVALFVKPQSRAGFTKAVRKKSKNTGFCEQQSAGLRS
jgi:hypothetical protein